MQQQGPRQQPVAAAAAAGQRRPASAYRQNLQQVQAVYGRGVAPGAAAAAQKRPPSAADGIPMAVPIDRQQRPASAQDRRQQQPPVVVAAEFRDKHQELVNKQRMDRINQAREHGWRNLMVADPAADAYRDAAAVCFIPFFEIFLCVFFC